MVLHSITLFKNNINRVKKLFKLKKKKSFKIINRMDRSRFSVKFTNRNSLGFLFTQFNIDFKVILFYNAQIGQGATQDYVKSIKSEFSLCYAYMYSRNYFLWIPLLLPKRNLFFFNKNANCLSFSKHYSFLLDFGLLFIIQKWLKSVVKGIFKFIFIKFRYKGKNYRWHRRKRGLVIRFGHSHLISIKKPISVFLKKKGRMRMIFFGTNLSLIRNYLKRLIIWKPLNVYTARGLRLSRQTVLRKSGKVSAYR